jgi:hypothetical protein
MPWQRAIDHSLPDILPKSHDWNPITHPLLSEEIESVLREHVGLRITLFTVTVALLVGNAWLGFGDCHAPFSTLSPTLDKRIRKS